MPFANRRALTSSASSSICMPAAAGEEPSPAAAAAALAPPGDLTGAWPDDDAAAAAAARALCFARMMPEVDSSCVAFRFASSITDGGKAASSATWIPKDDGHAPSWAVYNIVIAPSDTCAVTCLFFTTDGSSSSSAVSSW